MSASFNAVTGRSAVKTAMMNAGVTRPLAFASVTFAMAIVFAGANLIAPLWPVYRSDLHLTAFALMIVFAAYALGAMCALLALGGLSDAIGRRPILQCAVAGTILASLLFAFADDIAWLLAARFVQGLAVGGVSAAANAALNDFAARSRIAAVAGSIATSAGFAAGPFMAGIVADLAPNPRQTAFFVLAACAVPAFVAMVLIPNSGRRAGARYRLNAAAVPATIRAPFARAALTFSAGWLGGAIFLSLGPSVITQLLGTSSHTIAGTTLLAFFAASAVAQFAFRATSTLVTLRAANIGITAGLLLAAAAASWHSLPAFFLAIVVAGGAQGIALLGGLALLGIVTPERQRGGVLSAFFLCGYVPVVLLLPATGGIADRFGLATSLDTFAAVIAACALVALADLARWSPVHLRP